MSDLDAECTALSTVALNNQLHHMSVTVTENMAIACCSQRHLNIAELNNKAVQLSQYRHEVDYKTRSPFVTQ